MMDSFVVVSLVVVLVCTGLLYFLLAPHIHDWLRQRRQKPLLALCEFLQKEFAGRPLIHFRAADRCIEVGWGELGKQNDPCAAIRAAVDSFSKEHEGVFTLQQNACNCTARILRL